MLRESRCVEKARIPPRLILILILILLLVLLLLLVVYELTDYRRRS